MMMPATRADPLVGLEILVVNLRVAIRAFAPQIWQILVGLLALRTTTAEESLEGHLEPSPVRLDAGERRHVCGLLAGCLSPRLMSHAFILSFQSDENRQFFRCLHLAQTREVALGYNLHDFGVALTAATLQVV
jgi:hypothetical protein